MTSVSRRQVLGMAGVVGLGLPPVSQSDRHGMTVTVAADGSGDFGPETPGTTTSGIQEAIDALKETGGIVHLRRGAYEIDNVMPPPEAAQVFGCGNRSLGIYDNITLRGEGIDRTIIQTAGKCNTNAILGWETSNIAIEDLTFDGAGLNEGYGIAIFGMGTNSFRDVWLRRVKCVNFGVSALAVAGGERVVVEQCVTSGSKTGFEMGSPSKDYWMLHCTAFGCSNSTLIFNPGDHFNEMGNVNPHVVGGRYDGGGTATGVAMWDCWQPIISSVTGDGGRDDQHPDLAVIPEDDHHAGRGRDHRRVRGGEERGVERGEVRDRRLRGWRAGEQLHGGR